MRASLSFEFVEAGGYVFRTLDGSSRNPMSTSQIFTRRVEKARNAIGAKLPVLTLHSLRHTHASELLEAGENPKVVQERLGHTTITTTLDAYAHVTPTMQKSAAIRFADAVGGA